MKQPTRSRTWSCPECGREFARARQWHSCAKRSVSPTSQGRNVAVRRIFDRLTRRLKSLGPYRIDAVKTSINLVANHHLGVTVREDSLRVGFLASGRIDDSRIVHTLRLGANRVGHWVVLSSPEDVDDQLMDWLARPMNCSRVDADPPSARKLQPPLSRAV